MPREALEQDLKLTLTQFIENNKSNLTDLILQSFHLTLNDTVKSQIKNAIQYHKAEFQADIDVGMKKKLSQVIKSFFSDEIERLAIEICNSKINSNLVEEKIDLIMEKDLKRFMQREVKLRVQDMMETGKFKLTL